MSSLTCQLRTAVVLFGLLVSACAESGDEADRAKQLSQSCSINSDCAEDLVCAFGRCHEECTAARDCEDPSLCVQSGESDLLVCQLDDDIDCSDDDDCREDQVCAVGGRCRDLCESNDDCVDGQVCASDEQVCANDAEVDGDGALVGSGSGEEASVSDDADDDDRTDEDTDDADDDTDDADDDANGAGGSAISAPGISVAIPSDATDDPGDIAVGGEESDAPELPGNWTALSEVFSVQPLGTELARPVTIELEYAGDAEQLGVAIARDANDDWALLDDPDFDDGIARVATDTLGYFVVVGFDDEGDPGSMEPDAGGETDDDSVADDGATTDDGTVGMGTLETNQLCQDDFECADGVCDVVCLPPSCSDGVANGQETGLDCGGNCLAGCPNGSPCGDSSDCETGACIEGLCAPLVCPGEPGVAEMVPLRAGFCIDSTEVTRAQYTAWLAGNPSVEGQIEECAFNDSFAPDTGCMASTNVCAGDCGDHPQVCVDWCDAAAYCEGVGKRLCGNVDPSIKSYAYDTLDSQWHYACTSAGLNTYPYGTTYDDTACNTTSANTENTEPTGSFEGCQAPAAEFAGVFDLVGNVSEWEDNCAEDGLCNMRGYYYGAGAGGQCAYSERNFRDLADYWVGFRCCSH